MAALEAEADQETGHLECLFIFLSLGVETHNVKLSGADRCMLRGKVCPSSYSFYRLRSGGVLIGASAQAASLRDRLYENFLRKRLP